MALQDYNQLIIERLQDVREAAEEGEPDQVRELLETLESEGYDADALADVREQIDDLEQVAAWVVDRLEEMKGEENPFADMAFDIDDAFLDVEDTGFRDIADDVDDDVDLLAGLELDSSSAIELVDPADEGEEGAEDEFDLFDGLDDADEIEIEVGGESSAEQTQDGEPSDPATVEAAFDDEEASDDESDVRGPRQPLLSGKFNVPDPKSILARKKKQSEKTIGELAAGPLDEALPADEEDGGSDDRETRPNVTPDLSQMAESEGEEALSETSDAGEFESGESKVRYAAGEAPPPPAHRLPGADVSGEIALSPPEISDEDTGRFKTAVPRDDATPFSPAHQEDEGDELEFDLGFENPEEKRTAAADAEWAQDSESTEEAPRAPEVADDASTDGGFFGGGLDFDLGLENPEAARAAAEESSTSESSPSPPVSSDASETKPRGEVEDAEEPEPRERIQTPLANEQDDMFFELAEALAAESSGVEAPYRGEPKVPTDAAETNPFAHEAPTGTAHSALESVVAAAQSNIATNLNAILLEARRLRSTGELEAAFDITKKILSRSDNEHAQELQDEISAELEERHVATIGSLEEIPSLNVDMSELAGLDLDHRAGFLLSQMDGLSSFEDLIELSGMSRLETLGVLAQLIDKDLVNVD